MKLLEHLLQSDPAAPRLTVYTESTGARMDFSAQTLDNWASKIANLLEEELDLTEGDSITIDLPVGWQAAVIALGAIAARVSYDFIDATLAATESAEKLPTGVVFTELSKAMKYNGDVLVVSDDPFGRGITETGGELPDGVLDFGPTVRFYGDQYFGDCPSLATAGVPERVLSTGWTDKQGFIDQVLTPLAKGGSTVVIAGLASAQRLEEIAANEKVTVPITNSL